MSEQQIKILNLLSDGKINAEEADRLLKAVKAKEDVNFTLPDENDIGSVNPKFLIVKVNSQPGVRKHEDVDIKIPIMLLKAGMKIGSFLPKDAKVKFNHHLSDSGLDIDINKIDAKNIDEFISALKDNPIVIKTDQESIKILCV